MNFDGVYLLDWLTKECTCSLKDSKKHEFLMIWEITVKMMTLQAIIYKR